jgi:hypothetical protein
LYNQQNNLLLQINDLIPEISIIKNRKTNVIYDENISVDLNSFVNDLNIVSDTNKLYYSNSISMDRNFIVVQIENKKYYLVKLNFKNNSDSAKTITFVETIPKEVSRNITDLLFSEKITIINEDPVIMYTFIIPANTISEFEYTKKSPITDFDVVSKFDVIKFTQPTILDGNVSIENIIIPPETTNIFRLLLILIVILLILIVIVFISSKKKKRNTGLNVEKSKEKAISGELNNSNNLSGKTQNNISNNDDITKNDDFKNNYDYIVNAVKRNDR